MAEKNGVLSSFGIKEFEDLKRGLERGNPALGTSGGPSKSNVLGALTSIGTKAMNVVPVGQAISALNVYGNVTAEQAAAAALGRDPVYSAAVLGDPVQNFLTNNMSPSAMSMVRTQADTNNDGVVTPEEVNQFGMGRGLTAYDVGIDMGRPDVNIKRTFSARQNRENPPTVRYVSPTSPANPANYINKDFGQSYSTTASDTIETIKDNIGINPAPTPEDLSPSNPENFVNKDFGAGGPPKGVGNQPQTPDEPGKSIVCTEMYRQTQLDDWAKAMKVWDVYQKKHLTIFHEIGYHWLFKPYVRGMKKSNSMTKIGAYLAKERTQHLKHILTKGKAKDSFVGNVWCKIIHPVVYIAGKLKIGD